MKDAFGRTIDYLRLSVTERCNLHCVYCMPSAGGCSSTRAVCTLEELVELAAACVALGVKKIRLTGGEPLLRGDILALVERLSTLHKDGLEELCMTTNGKLLAEYAAPLQAAGLDRLNISLDTLREDRFRSLTQGGALSRVLDGIAAAEAAGFARLSLNTVLMKGFNDDEIPELAMLAHGKPWTVRFIELMPIGPAAAMREAYLPATRVLELVPELQLMQDAHAGVARLYTAPGWVGAMGLISPMSCDFCGQCSRIRITADGRLKLCLHAAEEIPLRGLHGAALQQAIQVAVQRKPARHQLAEFQPSQSIRPMNEIGG